MRSLVLLSLCVCFVLTSSVMAADLSVRRKGNADGIFGSLAAYREFYSAIVAKDFKAASQYCSFPMNDGHHLFHKLNRHEFEALAQVIFDDECLRELAKVNGYPIRDLDDDFCEMAFDTEKAAEDVDLLSLDYLGRPSCFITIKQVNGIWKIVNFGEVRVLNGKWIVTK